MRNRGAKAGVGAVGERGGCNRFAGSVQSRWMPRPAAIHGAPTTAAAPVVTISFRIKPSLMCFARRRCGGTAEAKRCAEASARARAGSDSRRETARMITVAALRSSASPLPMVHEGHGVMASPVGGVGWGCSSRAGNPQSSRDPGAEKSCTPPKIQRDGDDPPQVTGTARGSLLRAYTYDRIDAGWLRTRSSAIASSADRAPPPPAALRARAFHFPLRRGGRWVPRAGAWTQTYLCRVANRRPALPHSASTALAAAGERRRVPIYRCGGLQGRYRWHQAGMHAVEPDLARSVAAAVRAPPRPSRGGFVYPVTPFHPIPDGPFTSVGHEHEKNC